MYDGSNNGRVRRRGENLMGKIASAIVAVTLLTSPLLLPVPASAENSQIAAGGVGGLIGGGGARAARTPPPPPPVYYAPEPVYFEEPACRLVRERYWDGYGWQFRRVQVCDLSSHRFGWLGSALHSSPSTRHTT